MCEVITLFSIQSFWKMGNRLGNGIKTVYDTYSCLTSISVFSTSPKGGPFTWDYHSSIFGVY